jgi:hypothetical protein
MKSIFTLLLICLLTNSALTSENTPYEGLINFFKVVELNELPKAYNETITDFVVVKNLVTDIVSDLSQSATWTGVADGVAKIGRVMEVISLDIVNLGNNTLLANQINLVLNKFNDFLNAPQFYLQKDFENIKANLLPLSWAVYDAYMLVQARDYSEFGTRFGNIVLLILEGTPIPRPTDSIVLAKNVEFEKMYITAQSRVRNLKYVQRKCSLEAKDFLMKIVNILVSTNPNTLDKIIAAAMDFASIITKCEL